MALAILMTLSLAACGTNNPQQESDTSSSDTTDPVSSADTTIPETTEPETEPDTDVVTVDKTQINVAVLAGPTGMGAVKLMQDNDAGTASNAYTFTVSAAPTEVTAGIINGSYDIAAVPTNLAATLYQKTQGGVQLLACNTMGVLYLLENGDTVNSLADLRGKTIYATGQGATPEYILRYLLTENGIDPDQDVTIEYYAEHAELATLMTEGSVTLGMLPEPNVTVVCSGNSDVRVALNLTEEWEKVGGDSALIMGCVVVNTAFAAEHPEAVEAFLAEYEASIAYVNENPAAASELIAEYGIVGRAALAEKAIPNCNICFLSGEEMKTKISGFFEVLFQANPASIGGQMPDDAFYYAG